MVSSCGPGRMLSPGGPACLGQSLPWGTCQCPSSPTLGVALAVHCCVLSFPQSLVAILCVHPKPPRTQDLRARLWLPTPGLLPVAMQATTMLALTTDSCEDEP